jgi:hypothetical protein
MFDYECKFGAKLRQGGFGLISVILSVVVILAAISASMMGGLNTAGMVKAGNVSRVVVAQAMTIRSRILQCGADYPTGQNGTGFRVPFPGASTSAAVSSLVCPGNSLGLWSWPDGVTAPPSIIGFTPWSYVNDASSMRLTITSTNAESASLSGLIVNMLGVVSSQSGISPSITITFVIAS